MRRYRRSNANAVPNPPIRAAKIKIAVQSIVPVYDEIMRMIERDYFLVSTNGRERRVA